MAGQDLEVEDGEEKVALYNISLRLHEFPCLIMYGNLLYCCSSIESSCILECPSWLLFYLSLPNGFVLISDIFTQISSYLPPFVNHVTYVITSTNVMACYVPLAGAGQQLIM